MRVVLLEETLHFVIAQLIPSLKSSVLLAMLLNCIICQMDVLIAQIPHCVKEATRTNVTIFVKIPLKSSIDRSEHRVHSDVEFTSKN